MTTKRMHHLDPKFIPHEERCARCGLSEPLWRGVAGVGYSKEGAIFCCEGCAEGANCFCKEQEVAVTAYDDLEP